MVHLFASGKRRIGMSHITRVKTQITDRDVLLETLKELGYQYEEDCRMCVGRQRPLLMDVVIREGRGYRIGLKRIKGQGVFKVYYIGISPEQQRQFHNRLLQHYARRKILKEARARNYVLVHERACEGNRVRLVLRRVA